jgi:thioredoxin reductase
MVAAATAGRRTLGCASQDRPRGASVDWLGRVAAGRWEFDPYLLETSVPGIFASGDVRFGPVKRVASAVGEGSMVVAFVHQYLRTPKSGLGGGRPGA